MTAARPSRTRRLAWDVVRSGGAQVGSQRAHAARRRYQVPARFTEQPHAAAKGPGPRLASHRSRHRAGRSRPQAPGPVSGHRPSRPPGAGGRGRHAPAVYRLRAGDLATAAWRDVSGQQSLNRALQVGQRLAVELGAIGDPGYA